MPNIKARDNIAAESRKRVKLMEFGDPVTNVCAGKENPHRHSYFVKRVTNWHTNGYQIKHKEQLIKCTDKKGGFWDTGIDVIYKGHLDYNECKQLFEPVREAQYG